MASTRSPASATVPAIASRKFASVFRVRPMTTFRRSEGRSVRANVGVELKRVRSGVERRRGVSGLKARGGRRDTPGSKVLKDRRSPRERGRMGTSV
eukprot:29820-Pelagococcus_subviridis.AAC.1